MSGRMQQDQKREKWIQDKLKKCPDIFSSYMVSLSKKTSSTRKQYLGYIIEYNNYLKSRKIDMYQAKPMHIQSYIDYLINIKENGNSIINTKLAAIINFYTFLVENELCTKNPCSTKMKLPIQEKEEVVYMTDEEVGKLKESILSDNNKYRRIRNYCIVQLGCSTGLRLSEIINIDVEDVDLENGYINNIYAKGNRKKRVIIGSNTINAVKQWMDVRKSIVFDPDQHALLVNQQGQRISVMCIEGMLQTHTKNIKKHITPHKMRSTCAMKLYDKTGDIYLTAQQLGHKDIRNTMIYARATDEKLHKAADILDE